MNYPAFLPTVCDPRHNPPVNYVATQQKVYHHRDSVSFSFLAHCQKTYQFNYKEMFLNLLKNIKINGFHYVRITVREQYYYYFIQLCDLFHDTCAKFEKFVSNSRNCFIKSQNYYIKFKSTNLLMIKQIPRFFLSLKKKKKKNNIKIKSKII